MAIVDAVKSWVIFRPKPSKGKKKMVVPVELKQKYLSRRIQDLVRLKEALTRNDFQPALRLGHQVKGNADTFEFPHMASIGVELEHAAKKEDKETLMSLVQKMESAILNAQNIFLHR